jgi:hypothetical protein
MMKAQLTASTMRTTCTNSAREHGNMQIVTQLRHVRHVRTRYSEPQLSSAAATGKWLLSLQCVWVLACTAQPGMRVVAAFQTCLPLSAGATSSAVRAQVSFLLPMCIHVEA